MLKYNRALLLFLGCLLLLSMIGSLHFFLDKGPAVGDRLIILTPHGDNIRQEMGQAFSEWHRTRFGTAPEVVWVDQGGTSEDLRYVQARFASTPASIGIDMFFGGGTPPFRTLARAGLLERSALSSEARLGIPDSVGGLAISAPEAGWYGVALASFGILYNRSLLASHSLPMPESWADLADPRAFGWVASVDPRGSGSVHVIYEIMLQKFGWEKGWEIIARMSANSRQFTKGASGTLPLISSGEAAYTVAIDQYAWSLIDEVGQDQVGFALPHGETLVTPDPAAIFKGAPHPLLARRFLEFLLSDTGQRLLMIKAGKPGGPRRLTLNRMAVRPSAYIGREAGASSVRGNPFAEMTPQGWKYSDSLTESRWAFLNDALGLWMVDSHERAAKVWKGLIASRDPFGAGMAGNKAGARQTRRRGKPRGDTEWEASIRSHRFFRPPVDAETAGRMAARWKDEGYRNRVMARWARELND